MKKKTRILRVITYYRIQPWKIRGELRKLISRACEFKGGTFDYKMKYKNFSELELTEIENIFKNHKNVNSKLH